MITLRIENQYVVSAQCSCTECPLALSLLAKTGSRWVVGVQGLHDYGKVMFPARNRAIRIPMPPDALKFTAEYDAHGMVIFDRIDLEIPTEAFNLGDPRADLPESTLRPYRRSLYSLEDE